MATKKDDRGLVDTARQTRGRRTRDGVVVYSEFSITMRVGVDNEFIKFTVGHERTSPSDSEDALTRTETAAWKWNEKVADKRIRRLQRILRQLATEREAR